MVDIASLRRVPLPPRNPADAAVAVWLAGDDVRNGDAGRDEVLPIVAARRAWIRKTSAAGPTIAVTLADPVSVGRDVDPVNRLRVAPRCIHAKHEHARCQQRPVPHSSSDFLAPG